jgi:transcriptional regulator with XRE-family HTH domain
MQRAKPNLRAFMAKRGLTEAAIAKLAGVSQPTVSRALRGSPKRTGKGRSRIFTFIHQELDREGLVHAGKSEVLQAFERVWGASEAHAAAIAKVVDALDGIRPLDKKEG